MIKKNYRKYIFLYTLICFSIVILQQFIHEYYSCITAPLGAQIRASKRLIVLESFAGTTFSTRAGVVAAQRLPIEVYGRRLRVGDRIVITGERQIIPSSTDVQADKATQSDVFLHERSSIDAGTFSSRALSVMHAVIKHGECKIVLRNQDITDVQKSEDSVYYPIFSLLEKVYTLRQIFLQTFTRFFPEPHGSLAYGVLFGDTPHMDQEFYELFIRVGVLHVVAASGYNVAIIASILGSVLRRCISSRRVVLVIVVTGIGLYAVIAGMSPSIVRASLMAVIAIVAQFFGRPYSAFPTLVITILIMLRIDPLLIFSASFQLSVAATIGIVGVLPLFQSHQANPSAGHSSSLTKQLQTELQSAFLTTFCAFVMTAPILAVRFGQVSLVSLVANTLLVWLIPLLMLLSSLFLIGTLSIPQLGILWMMPAWAIAQLFVLGVQVFDQIPFGSLQLGSISPVCAFVWYIILAILIWRKHQHDKTT